MEDISFSVSWLYCTLFQVCTEGRRTEFHQSCNEWECMSGGRFEVAALWWQVQKKKIWETIQPLLKTTDECTAVFQDRPMRVSAGIVTCKSLKGANVSWFAFMMDFMMACDIVLSMMDLCSQLLWWLPYTPRIDLDWQFLKHWNGGCWV